LTSDQQAYVANLLQRALDRGGNTHNVDDVLRRIETGQARLWQNNDSVGVTEVIQYPNKRIARIWLAAGNVDDIKEVEPAVCMWAKENKCQEVHIDGRHGWERVWKDYRAVRVTLVKELGE
jgi:hypothetical protein